MPTLDLTDAELAAITALIRRAIEEDRFPRASTPCAQPWQSSILQLQPRSPRQPCVLLYLRIKLCYDAAWR
jgi:hypothetical protein